MCAVRRERPLDGNSRRRKTRPFFFVFFVLAPLRPRPLSVCPRHLPVVVATSSSSSSSLSFFSQGHEKKSTKNEALSAQPFHHYPSIEPFSSFFNEGTVPIRGPRVGRRRIKRRGFSLALADVIRKPHGSRRKQIPIRFDSHTPKPLRGLCHRLSATADEILIENTFEWLAFSDRTDQYSSGFVRARHCFVELGHRLNKNVVRE